MLYRQYYLSPIGRLSLVASEESLYGIWLEGQNHFQSGVKEEELVDTSNPILKIDVYKRQMATCIVNQNTNEVRGIASPPLSAKIATAIQPYMPACHAVSEMCIRDRFGVFAVDHDRQPVEGFDPDLAAFGDLFRRKGVRVLQVPGTFLRGT